MMYSYRAVNDLGKVCKGLQDAANEADLELQLKRVGLDLIRAREGAGKSIFSRHKIGCAQLITFFFNLEQLVRAGVPLLEGLADLRDSMDDHRFRDIIAGMVEAIEGGARLSQAMAQHPEAFDEVFVSLIRAGEESGRLQEVFGRITDALKWQDELAAQTRSMMLYPAFVGTVVLGIAFFLMIYLVPQLAGFIKQAGQEIPLQTRMLLAVSDVFVHYWHIILVLPLPLFIMFRLALNSHPGLQYHLDRLKLSIHPTGPILRKIILARFAHTFAMMYGSGISILECLANARELAHNRVIAASMDQVMREIEAGRNLAQSFRNSSVFPPLVIRMIRVGETTGRLDAALYNVSYFYDRDVKEAVRRLQVMIEPTMTIILGLLLGWVMLSVLSPVYDIISKLKT
jgi:type IV pilus assembly protein PilC